MIAAISTIILVILFFAFGHITQGIKKLLGLVTKWLLKFLSFFGFKLSIREKSVYMSDEFKQIYKDIKIMKLSKKNIKQKSSINLAYFIVSIITILLIVFNLDSVTGNAISNWMYNLISSVGFIKSATDMNTFYTATLFSVLSFSATKVLSRWNETKQQRKENRDALLKLKATKLMSSKELLEVAKEKDEQKYKELK